MLAERQRAASSAWSFAAPPFRRILTSTTAVLLAGNPHQGVWSSGTTAYRWEPDGNRQSTQGMAVCLYDSGRRSRSTGKERDAETSLDHSLYRYSSAAQGRWTSPDPLPGWPEDPQSWNRYAYVRNNPLLLTDPLGLSYEICGVDGKDCGVYSDKQYEQLRKDKSFIIAKGKIYSRTKDGKQGDMLGSVKYQGPDLEDRGQAVSSGLAARADASNQLIATVAVGSTAVGVSGGAFVGFTGLSSGGLTTLATGGEAVGVEGLTAEQVALVSRWGRSGLQPGDWVMNGGTGLLTYLMSGKWQPGLGNQFANFTSGQNFLVPKATLQNPGWAENGLGWIKNLLGQRFFNP